MLRHVAADAFCGPARQEAGREGRRAGRSDRKPHGPAARPTYGWQSRARIAALMLSAMCVLGSTADVRSLPARACPASPAPVIDIDLPRYYDDAAGSRVEPGKLKAHREAAEPLTVFLNELTAMADKATVARDGKLAACPLKWIATWAEGNALLGTMHSAQADQQRKWDLTGIALAYLKLKVHATPETRAVVAAWLIRVTDAALKYFEEPGRKRNNHWYWMGLAAAATGLAANSDMHWQIGRRIMQDAASDVRSDGTLPKELAREGRALHYHAFALMALVPLAEIGRQRGEDWYALEDGALHRLVGTTLTGLRNPAIFDQLAAHPQERPVKPSFGWLPLYTMMHKDRVGNPAITMPKKHRWLGGDITLLPRALAGLPRA